MVPVALVSRLLRDSPMRFRCVRIAIASHATELVAGQNADRMRTEPGRDADKPGNGCRTHVQRSLNGCCSVTHLVTLK